MAGLLGKLQKSSGIIVLVTLLVVGLAVAYVLIAPKETFAEVVTTEESKKEEFSDKVRMSQGREKRYMWNMTGVGQNSSYDIRGEEANNPRDPTGSFNGSELEDNLTNQRVA